MFPSYLEMEKLVPIYFEPDKHFYSYLEREKVDPCYLETKNVVHNCQEQGKRL